jgi:hypothetical protein
MLETCGQRLRADDAGGERMVTIHQKIVEEYLAELAKSEDVSAEQVSHLRALLARDKKPKADDLVEIFTLPAGGDLT